MKTCLALIAVLNSNLSLGLATGTEVVQQCRSALLQKALLPAVYRPIALLFELFEICKSQQDEGKRFLVELYAKMYQKSMYIKYLLYAVCIKCYANLFRTEEGKFLFLFIWSFKASV